MSAASTESLGSSKPQPDSARIFALIPAAGVGRRMGAGCPKQYMPISGVPMLVRTVEALLAASRVERVFVVVSPEDAYIDEAAAAFAPHGERVKILRAGGAERADSVLGGLRAACIPADSWVLVHDAARPCVRPSEVAHLIDEVTADSTVAGGILAVPMADTVKLADDRRRIVKTVPRAGLWRAATPQLFRAGELIAALDLGLEGVTDEASAMERAEKPVKVVSCRATNIKVTEPGDDRLAESILEGKHMAIPQIRVGQGYDSHRLVDGRPLILGGITIPFEKGLDGHSDADVLLHAVTDAVLGAASLGDIGTHFPPSDPKWKGADSGKLLSAVMGLVHAEGWQVVNLDATVVCERPKLGKLKEEIRANVARILGVAPQQVSIKAKTNEKMDAVGHEEGMMAMASVLLAKA